jgi:hypothetical protein
VVKIVRVLWPRKVPRKRFSLKHVLVLRSKIFLRELTFSNTLSSNPKSSHSVGVGPNFSHKMLFYLRACTNFTAIFFIVQRHGSMTMHDYVYHSSF